MKMKKVVKKNKVKNLADRKNQGENASLDKGGSVSYSNDSESTECVSDDSITLTTVPEKKTRSSNFDSSPVKLMNHSTSVSNSPENEESLKSPRISLSLARSRTVKDSKSPHTQSMTSSSLQSDDIYLNGLEKKRKTPSEPSEDHELNCDASDNHKIKKIKRDDDTAATSNKMNFRFRKTVETKSEPPKRCKACFQLFNDAKLKKYAGHPEDALEEHVAITDPKLCLEGDQNGSFDADEARPSLKITQFSVYDKADHLCPIDGGLIERNVHLYFSGWLKRIDEDDVSLQDAVQVKDAGPINEWWVTGYDGGEKALVGISSPVADYYLLEPHPNYAPLMNTLIEKVYICKLVVEFLLEESNPTFEDLLNKIQTAVQPLGVPKLTEDSLFKHAQFISDQVISLDASDSISDSDDTEVASLITTPCMRTLVRLAAITFVKRKKMKQSSKRELKVKKNNFIKATTTPLVKDTFDSLFTNQLDGADNTKKVKARYQRCGICEICQLPDCGTCSHCLKLKGSSNRSNAYYCLKRKCPNMAIQEMEDSDPDDEDYYQKTAEEKAKVDVKTRQVRSSGGRKEVKWIGQAIHNDSRKIYYRSAKVGGEEFVAGDCVSVEPVSSNAPIVVGRIMYMWENKIGQKYMHIQWFCRGTETVLGETADPQELFLVDECDNAQLSCINSKVLVLLEESPADWAKQGGRPLSRSGNPVDPSNDKCFYYRKRYNVAYGRFEDIQPAAPCPITLAAHRFCASCDRLFRQMKSDAISVEEKLEDESNSKEVLYGLVRWKGEEYRAGCCVFLAPSVFQFKYPPSVAKEVKTTDKLDDEVYPEYYRKSSEYIKGCNISTPKPLCIGMITEIKTNVKDKLIVPADVCLKVTKFYRPENTNSTPNQIFLSDINMLYISEEEVTVSFENVVGKCTIVYSENVTDMNTWSNEGPNRFYFRKCYNSKNQAYLEPSKEHKQLGNLGKKVKGRTVRSDKDIIMYSKLQVETWPKISKPLRCLDVFAGCGGLSEGLHQSGVSETRWAIEHQVQAAEAFRVNHPGCTVYSEDCNALLKRVISGEKRTATGQLLPQKGEVELICGGPPCQGFSGMNRFNSKQYYLFKNSLVVTYLSYCDYYRPRFFILENVRNFVSFKRSMVLKLTIRCLQRMGYQVAFGVLQAGQYGVPQTRRRAMIIAAAPGEILPDFPEPTHVFNNRETQLAVVVDDKKFLPNFRSMDSAPYRTITVKDAISDLPKITNGAKTEIVPYGKDPMSHYQKMMRRSETMLRDHICKDLVPLVVARISHVPTTSGADWRDLPNIIVKLSDDTYTQKLQYTHRTKNNNKSSPARGVCSCAEGKPCNPSDRQFNTLIPWCLPHTGNRNNNWAGLYGRLCWDGYFSTTTTNPEPMSKQGRVLHPEQTRVVSVRECARSQGFYDSFQFYGSILDKHRQVGNAVPPLLAAAIGREIRKSISLKELSKVNNDSSVSEDLKDP